MAHASHSFVESCLIFFIFTYSYECVSYTDLESRPATTPRLIARSSILKPIFGKKLLQLEDFALQQQGFLHVIPMATLTAYNLT